MLNFLKKHEKKAIAVVMVLLMITFVASSGYGRGATGGGSKVAIGTINGTKVYNADLTLAHQEWQLVNQYVKFTDRQTGRQYPFGQYVFAELGAPRLFADISDRPELFMLLRHEAREAPVQVDPDEFAGDMVNCYQPPPNVDDPEGLESSVRAALGDLLLIKANALRVASVVKVSSPLRQQKLAELVQKVTLNVVRLPAADFLPATPAPTPQQVQTQFDKYADVVPGAPTADNPFGFGYKLPERVKLQYLKIDHADAARAVQAQKTPYDWDVAARLYYLRHLSDFPATQPAPTTQTVTVLPSTQPAAPAMSATPSVPAAQPFEQVRQAALESVRQPMVDKLVADVQSFALSSLTAAASASASANTVATAGATTQPASASSLTLFQIAGEAMTRFGVRVEVSTRDDRYYAATELNLPTLSDPLSDPADGPSPGFADMVMQQASAYLGRSDLGSAGATTALLTPAPPVTDGAHDVFIYRLTAARPAEAAPDLTAAGGQPIADVKMQAAFDAAKTAGSKLVDIAGHSTLVAAAMASGRHVQTTPPVNLISRDLGPALPLSPAGQTAFNQQAMQLLAAYQPGKPAPLSIISVPQDRLVFVAQLGDVTPDANPSARFAQLDELSSDLRFADVAQLLREWCSYDAVAARLGYKPEPVKS